MFIPSDMDVTGLKPHEYHWACPTATVDCHTMYPRKDPDPSAWVRATPSQTTRRKQLKLRVKAVKALVEHTIFRILSYFDLFGSSDVQVQIILGSPACHVQICPPLLRAEKQLPTLRNCATI